MLTDLTLTDLSPDHPNYDCPIRRQLDTELSWAATDLNHTWAACDEFVPAAVHLVNDVHVVAPSTWSETAVSIAYSRWAYKAESVRERSIYDMAFRLAYTWATRGNEAGYFDSDEETNEFMSACFQDILLQKWFPNSPQWFNTGIYDVYGIVGDDCGLWRVDPHGDGTASPVVGRYTHPQVSACFIQGVEDELTENNGILPSIANEARLFKMGSGVGSNWSPIRHKGAPLSNGGFSSGLLSFLKIGDANAGAIKSGGTTRRAAKMVCLDVSHPDIVEFVEWKLREEDKVAQMAWASQQLAGKSPEELREMGVPKSLIDRIALGHTPNPLDLDFNGEAVATVSGQNSNNSIRIPDAFLEAVDDDAEWDLKSPQDGSVVASIPAKVLWDKICLSAWACADPGVQFSDLIEAANPVSHIAPINASNPCVTGDTLVLTSKGYKRIDSLTEEPFEVMCGDGVFREVAPAFYTGDREVLMLVTEQGRRIKATADHLFLAACSEGFGWEDVPLKDLRVGDTLQTVGRRGHLLGMREVEVTFVGGKTIRLNIADPVVTLRGHNYDRIPPEALLPGDKVKSGRVESVRVLRTAVGSEFKSGSDRVALITPVGGLVEVHFDNGDPAALDSAEGVVVFRNPAADSLPHSFAIGGVPGRIRKEITADQLLPGDHVVNGVGGVREVTEVRPSNLTVPVYDITEPVTSHFVANGLTIHNCSEFLYLDNTSCNLASTNLIKFLDVEEGYFDYQGLCDTARRITKVLDISVGMASFPSKAIAEGTYKYRTLGMGFSNLGGLLMALGVPYDSDTARDWGQSIAQDMMYSAQEESKELGERFGNFHGFNEGSARIFAKQTDQTRHPVHMRNAQHMVIAPCGTIGLGMDCDALGVEPCLGLITYKKLADSDEVMTLVNSLVPTALHSLGYCPDEVATFEKTLLDSGGDFSKAADALGMLSHERDVFATSLGTPNVPWEAHVKMLAAIQPHISGGISKTINMPEESTVEDVSRAYRLAHELGVKCVALFRNGCKDAPYSTRAPVSDDSNDNRRVALSEEESLHLRNSYVQVAKVAVLSGQSETETYALLAEDNTADGAPFTCEELDEIYEEGNRLAEETSRLAVEEYRTRNEIRSNVPYFQEGALTLTRNERRARQRLPRITREMEAEAPLEDLPADDVYLRVVGAARGRREPPALATAIKAKATVAGQHTMHITVPTFPDGSPSEVFVETGDTGSATNALTDTVARLASKCLQMGLPVEELIELLQSVRFEPSGLVSGPDEFRNASGGPLFVNSPLGVVAKVLSLASKTPVAPATPVQPLPVAPVPPAAPRGDARCPACGSPNIIPSGVCKVCADCGESVGGCS